MGCCKPTPRYRVAAKSVMLWSLLVCASACAHQKNGKATRLQPAPAAKSVVQKSNLVEATRSSGEAYAAFLKAELFEDEGELRNAKQELKEALIHDPESRYLMHRLSETSWKLGEFEEALAWNNKSLFGGGSPNWVCWRALMLGKMGQVKDAREKLRQLIDSDVFPENCHSEALDLFTQSPVNLDLLTRFETKVLNTRKGAGPSAMELAERLLEAGEWAHGTAYLNRAQQLMPLDRGLAELAWRYAMTFQDNNAAIEKAQAIYLALPSKRNAHRWLLTLLLSGKIEEAALLSPQLFDHRRQGEDTNIWWPWMTLGLEQEAAKRFGIQKVPRKMQVAFLKERMQKDPHRFDANQVCALESDATAIANCLKVLIQTGDLSRANEKLLALLKEHELNGTMLRMWLRLAVGPPAIVNQRQMERVFQFFVLEQEPDLEFYVARLDAAMLFQGQDAALDLAEELVGEGGNRQIWAVVFWYLENGHASDAVDLVEGLMRQISKTEPYLLNLLAYALVENDDRLEEAVSYARRALMTDPLNAAVMDTLGWAMLRSGRLDEAVAVLERARALMPAEVEIAFHLATAYQRAGRAQDALDTLGEVRHVFTFSNRLQKHIKELREKLNRELKDGV